MILACICPSPACCSAEAPARCSSHTETAWLSCNSTSQVVFLETKSVHATVRRQKSEGCVVEHKNLPTLLSPYVHLFLAGHHFYLQRERRVSHFLCLREGFLFWKVRRCDLFLGQTDLKLSVIPTEICKACWVVAAKHIWHLSDRWRDRGRQMLTQFGRRWESNASLHYEY